MLFTPYAPLFNCRQSSPRCNTNRFALVLFTLTALAGQLVRYLA